MKMLKAIALVGIALSVAACSQTTPRVGGTLPAVQQQALLTPTLPQPVQPADTTPIQQASLAAGNFDYIDSSVFGQLSAAQRNAARDAQFYALQFGRPGAPRSWSSGGATGQVSVGPYVRVNNLDCREFSHRVTVGGETYTRSGQACREVDGAWSVTA